MDKNRANEMNNFLAVVVYASFLYSQPKINRLEEQTNGFFLLYSFSTHNLSIQLPLFCHAFGHFTACYGFYHAF